MVNRKLQKLLDERQTKKGEKRISTHLDGEEYSFYRGAWRNKMEREELEAQPRQPKQTLHHSNRHIYELHIYKRQNDYMCYIMQDSIHLATKYIPLDKYDIFKSTLTSNEHIVEEYI